MSRNKKTSIFILLLLVLIIYLLAAFPGIFTVLSGQVQVKSAPNSTEKSSMENESSSSLQNSSLPEHTIDIMIDPGHGGADTGADKGHVTESEVTLDISNKLKKYLEDRSYSIGLTRNSDISLYQLSGISGTIQKRELDARVNIINKSGAKIFVSVHVNSYPEYPGMSGSIVYYNPENSQSRDLSGCIQKKLNGLVFTDFKRDRHDPQEADFYLLKNSNITGVLVETAFITNSYDHKLLSQDGFRSRIAEAIAEGIDDYINNYK